MRLFSFSSPEGSLCLSSDEGSGGSLELCWGHPHGLLHLSGGGGNEVLVNVSPEPLLSQHPPHQLNGGTDGLLAARHLGAESCWSSRPGNRRVTGAVLLLIILIFKISTQFA